MTKLLLRKIKEIVLQIFLRAFHHFLIYFESLVSNETYIYIMLYRQYHKMKNSEVDVDYQLISPRFSVENIEELQQGIEYLNERGYAVFKNILTNDEINNSVDLLWKHLENLKKPSTIQRNDPTTWDMNWYVY